ncbi:hypothetical protein J4206_03250 [Candidatus Woesearchaeota archaeon]|nr:hypothetical protein [Candidatus Woesearchaeota archaeon]
MEYKRTITKQQLIDIIKVVDSHLQKNAPLIAIGGSALTLLGLKRSSDDVDFIIDDPDKVLKAEVTVGIYAQGYEGQIQDPGVIVTTILPKDYIQKSLEDKEISKQLTKIKLRILSPLDVILTKLARFDEKDIVDITAILKTFRYTWKIMKTRYSQYLKLRKGREHDEYITNFERLKLLYEHEIGPTS